MRNSSLSLFQKQRLQRITLFIGRSHSWASDADVQGNTIAEGTDASPPTPNDDVASEFYNYDDMLGAKIIASTDVSHCIPRRNWTTGTTYDKYEHNISSSNAANSGATNLFDSTFVVMNSSYAVYKVIDNDGNTASTVEPTSTSNSIFTTSDNYKWKYMYSLTSAETLNFMSTDFIHVSTDSTVSAAAVDGALDTIEIIAGGSSFNTSSGSTISAIPIRGDGSSGVASVTISSGAITAASVTTAGTGYTFAYIRTLLILLLLQMLVVLVQVHNLNVIIPPKGGHGANAVKELGGFYVMMNKSLVGIEGTSDIGVANDFRRIGLLRDPYNFGTTTVASAASTRRQLYATVFSSVSGTFTADEEINQATTGAVGKVVEYDSTNKILYWYQTRFPDVGTDTNGNLTAFSGANAITGQTSSAAATPNTSNSNTVNGVVFSSGYSSPELAFDSGDIIYVEERSPITRASDQTENIKLIVEF